MDRFGHAVLGIGFIAAGFGSLAVLGIDVLKGRALGSMSRSEMRARLRRVQRSRRYVVKRTHIRGMTIGAVFFGAAAIFGLCVQILNFAGIVDIGAD